MPPPPCGLPPGLTAGSQTCTVSLAGRGLSRPLRSSLTALNRGKRGGLLPGLVLFLSPKTPSLP